MKLGIPAPIGVGIGVGLVALVGVYLIARQAPAAAGAALDAVNPVNPDNIFHRGANAVGAAVTDDKDFSLGARVWEWLNPGEVRRERQALGNRPIFRGSEANARTSSSAPGYTGSDFWIGAP